MKNTKNLWLLVAVIVVFNFAIFLNPKITNSASSNCTTITSSIKFGSKNKSEIIKLQDFLKSQGYMTIESTGYFGNVTEKALKSFQRSEGIPSLGIVGPITKFKISQISCVPSILEKPVVIVPEQNIIKTSEIVSLPKLGSLPYNSTNFLDWNGVWGKVSTTSENTLLIRAGESTSGAQAILLNSNEWTNYKLTVNALVRQGTVILISRYVDENNFLGCNFSGKYVEIIQKLNGVSSVVGYTTVADAPYSQYFHNDLNLSMRVDGKNVGCTLIGSDDNVTFSNVNEFILKGGVGVQTWVGTTGVANIEIKSVKVLSI